ncbi:MAG: 2-amino-4-hydroxy-6-hydroxymethyldihydropteridine diphosphokinase [Candidatus Omnitrophota bacterium]
MVTCCLGIGSNLGDRLNCINAAIRKIRSLPLTRVNKISEIIESLPEGGPAQGMYLNGVIEIETELNPYQLLQELQKIESNLGRVRAVVNGPRTIDLDILTYADAVFDEQALCIPHPRILEREFVLRPLRQIAPQLVERLLKQAREKSLNTRRVNRSTKRSTLKVKKIIKGKI